MAGKRGKKKSLSKSSSRKDSSSSNGTSESTKYRLRLRAEPEFYEAVESKKCPGNFGEPQDVSDPGVALVMNDWQKLHDLIAWFAAGVEVDASAKLEFPVDLPKERRSEVHRTVTSKFGAHVESYSEGYGAQRFISVVKKGCAPKREASAEQEQQAALLYKLAREAGMEVSRDEIKERIIDNQLTEELAALWQTKGVEQQALHKLCEAAASGDLEALKSLIAAHPEVVRSSTAEIRSGTLPLHAAAAAGQLQAVQALADAGASLEALNDREETPLQAARKAEQCEAEGLLLQLGAHDPDADLMPVVVAPTDAPVANSTKETKDALLTPTPKPIAPPSLPTPQQPLQDTSEEVCPPMTPEPSGSNIPPSSLEDEAADSSPATALPSAPNGEPLINGAPLGSAVAAGGKVEGELEGNGAATANGCSHGGEPVAAETEPAAAAVVTAVDKGVPAARAQVSGGCGSDALKDALPSGWSSMVSPSSSTSTAILGGAVAVVAAVGVVFALRWGRK